MVLWREDQQNEESNQIDPSILESLGRWKPEEDHHLPVTLASFDLQIFKTMYCSEVTTKHYEYTYNLQESN